MAQGRSTKIVSMIKWIWTSRLATKNSLSLWAWGSGFRVSRSVIRFPGTGFRVPVFGSRGPFLKFRVPGFGFLVSGFAFCISDSGFRDSGSSPRVSDFEFRIPGFGIRVPGFAFHVPYPGFQVLGFGFQDSGSRFRVAGIHCDARHMPVLLYPQGREHPPRPGDVLLSGLRFTVGWGYQPGADTYQHLSADK